MRDYLLFRLAAPMASWGDIAVGEHRPTDTHPTRSAMLGLLTAAKGIRRDEEAVLQRFSSSYGVAVATDSAGIPLRDYHTIQVPPQRRKTRFRSRQEELKAEKLNTIVSTRDYRAEVLHRVCVWAHNPAAAPFSLHELADALSYPVFTLYLGRKSCPPMLPMQPQVKAAAAVRDAFAIAEFCSDFLDGMTLDARVSYYWDDADHIGMKPQQTFSRRDQPHSRARWQFVERQEHYCSKLREDDR